MRYRVIGVAAVVMAFSACGREAVPSERKAAQNIDKVQVGMSMEQAYELLGAPDNEDGNIGVSKKYWEVGKDRIG